MKKTIYGAALALAVLVAGCSGGSDAEDAGSAPTLVESGSGSVVIDDSQLADDEEEAGLSASPGDETSAGSQDSDDDAVPEEQEADDAIPLEEEDDRAAPLQAVDAITVFNECLAREGFEFVGVPDQGDPESIAEYDPAYLTALGACATESSILEAFEAMANESDNLTIEEIEQRNLIAEPIRQCLLAKGWEYPELVPDANGMLGPDGTPLPPGLDEIGDDVNVCIQEATAELEAAGG